MRLIATLRRLGRNGSSGTAFGRCELAELLTAGGLILTVLLAYLQIQKQHRSSFRLQEEHLRNELKVQIYNEVSEHLQTAANALGRAESEYRSALLFLDSQQSGPVAKSTQTSEDITKAASAASRAISKLLILFEKYEIVFLNFSAIQREFGDQHRHLLEANWKLSSKLMMYLPMEGLPEEAASVFPFKPKPEDLEEMEALFSSYAAVVNDTQGYILDVQVEAQNELLGKLFGRHVLPRNPDDPSVKVLKRDLQPRSERPKGRWV